MTKLNITNKKARYDYEILDSLETGIVLRGHEVKSIREGKASIKEAYAKIINNELWLVNANISRFKNYTCREYDPTRTRKLLIKKSELNKLIGKVKEKGLALVPLAMYLKNNKLVKLEIGIGKGKKKYDKRETIKKKQLDQELKRKFGRN